jgi:hypothetical protein
MEGANVTNESRKQMHWDLIICEARLRGGFFVCEGSSVVAFPSSPL